MPHIDLSMYPGRSEELKLKVARALRKTLIDELKIDKSVISVSIKEVESKDWAEHKKNYNDIKLD